MASEAEVRKAVQEALGEPLSYLRYGWPLESLKRVADFPRGLFRVVPPLANIARAVSKCPLQLVNAYRPRVRSGYLLALNPTCSD
jgi:hypothetical protein